MSTLQDCIRCHGPVDHKGRCHIGANHIVALPRPSCDHDECGPTGCTKEPSRTPLTDSKSKLVKLIGPINQTIDCDIVYTSDSRAIEERLWACVEALEKIEGGFYSFPLTLEVLTVAAQSSQGLADLRDKMICDLQKQAREAITSARKPLT